MIAHECGHQLLARDPIFKRNLPVKWSEASDEILASILGSLLVSRQKDRQDLISKATVDAFNIGLESDRASLLVTVLREQLEAIL